MGGHILLVSRHVRYLVPEEVKGKRVFVEGLIKLTLTELVVAFHPEQLRGVESALEWCSRLQHKPTHHARARATSRAVLRKARLILPHAVQVVFGVLVHVGEILFRILLDVCHVWHRIWPVWRCLAARLSLHGLQLHVLHLHLPCYLCLCRERVWHRTSAYCESIRSRLRQLSEELAHTQLG